MSKRSRSGRWDGPGTRDPCVNPKTARKIRSHGYRRRGDSHQAVGPRRVAVSCLALRLHYTTTWAVEGVILLWLLLATLVVREFTRVCYPATRLIPPLTLASLPLIVLLVSVIVLRFAALS